MIRLISCCFIVFACVLGLSCCKPPAEPQVAASEDDAHDHEAGDHDHHDADALHADEVVLSPSAIQEYCVKVDRAQRRQLRPTFVAPARVNFNVEAMAHVGSPLVGRAVELGVRLGDDVHVGDALIVVESPDLGVAQSDFLIKRTAAHAAAPAAELAKLSWERAQRLYESTQGIALTEVQKREAEHRSALAALHSAEAEAMAAENHLHLLGMTREQIDALSASGEVQPRLTIRSPIAGRVVQREVTLGELVRPDQQALLVLADMRTLWILADVPESRVHDVRVGSRGWVRIGGMDGRLFEGTVAFIAPFVDANTRTAQVRIEVPVSDASLKPGMFAQVEIERAASDGIESASFVVVPEEAIQIVEGGPAVFVPVAEEPNTFAKRAVAIGTPVSGFVPVFSGLSEGDPFVSAGSFILKAELGKSGAAHEH